MFVTVHGLSLGNGEWGPCSLRLLLLNQARLLQLNQVRRGMI